MAEVTSVPPPSREGYHAEWLAYEDQLGMRPSMSGNQEVDIPIFNQMGVQLASLWPKVEEPLEISEEVIAPNVKARVYKPSNASAPVPVMVYFHGGGYISGNLDTEDPHCQILAAKTPAVVISVDYPLTSPPSNAPLDKVIDAGVHAVNWAKENAARFNGNPEHLLIAGGSAGGCLATQVINEFITKGSPKTIRGAVLFFAFCSPMPYTGPYPEEYKSMEENATGAPFLHKDVLVGMWQTAKADMSNPRHFPMIAPKSNFALWPPTYLCAAGRDPECDDSVILEHVLRDANVPVKLDLWKGFPHYFHWFPMVPSAAKCMETAVEGAKFVVGASTT